MSRPARSDLLAATLLLGLFALAAVVGAVRYLAGHPMHASAAPLFAHWLPHVGPGTPLAVAVALLVWRYGPALADRLPWGWLLAVSYAAATAWILSLALVDGWSRGVAGRLTTQPEYLHDVPGITDIPAMLRGFTGRILDSQPDSWTTHVAGHPPGALLIFVMLDRAGLGGGGWAGLLCILVGAVPAVAVPITVRLLGTDADARAAVPYAVLFPGAVWIGVSADGLFAGVTSAGIAFLAYGISRRRTAAAFAGGVLIGAGCYLSYGLVLLAVIVAAVLILTPAYWPAIGAAASGAASVVVAFTAAGFDWITGYRLVVERYYQGIAAHRPYAYWVWADIAILAVAAGPAAAAVVRRAARAGRDSGAVRLPLAGHGNWLLPLAAALAILAADLSGYSKAEVERIWLPFTVWFAAGAGLLPSGDRRTWLAVQATVALTVNHLLLTTW